MEPLTAPGAFKNFGLICLWMMVCFFGLASAIPKSELFPYGVVMDQALNGEIDDTSSPEIPLKVPITFYGVKYDSIFINDNGLISFLTEVPSFFNAQFPLSYPIIAPLYTDVDTRQAGSVYYRETQALELLDRAKRDIRSHFSSASSFFPKSLFIVTWDAVGHYEQKASLMNTFQVVIASDEEDSFIFFLYPEGGVQWIQSDGKNKHLPDARAQAGFMSGDGRLYTLRGSGTDQAKNFDRMSNIRKPGVWLFHSGKTGLNGNILPANIIDGHGEGSTSNNNFEKGTETCASAEVPCPPTAVCKDHRQGFCCVCREGYLGNGRNCIETVKPARMSGKLNLKINDVTLENVITHSYVVTGDGRTYTAISKIPSTIGYDMTALFTLGGVVGWMFAVPKGNAKNGFTITGGVFNRTSEVAFPQTGHQIVIQEEFLGPDAFNDIRWNVRVEGTLPSIPVGAKIKVDDYEEEYTKVSKGQIRAKSAKSYRLEDNSLEVPFVVEQKITFEENCPFAEEDADDLSNEAGPPDTATRLRVSRNYIVYEDQDEILRIAATNSISTLNGDFDPCKEGKASCGPNSECVVEGNSFRCICNRGFEYLYEQIGDGEKATCIDVNECLVMKDNCDINAECINMQGSFACRCRNGYLGNGVQCERKMNCQELNCDMNADCVELPNQNPTCQCKEAYQGDGFNCRQAEDVERDCRDTDYCHPHADCLFSTPQGRHICVCQEGYRGDGLTCSVQDIDDDRPIQVSCQPDTEEEDCSADARCVFDNRLGAHQCICNVGFEGDGADCRRYQERDLCQSITDCSPWAQCVFQGGRYECRCNAGFVGDGIRCTKSDNIDCSRVNICSVFAKCQYEPSTQRSVCLCDAGYEGDGRTCLPVDECNSVEDCDPNSQCIYDSDGQRYRCQCNQGYSGDGKQCTLDKETCKDVPNMCHTEARCIYDSVSMEYRCQCLAGYQGDGLDCQRTVLSCNVINDCHTYGECLYDHVSRGYRCHCKSGYEGDGHFCRATQGDCRLDTDLCDSHAECKLNPISRSSPAYICQCNEDFVGDGITCSVAPKHGGDYLVIAQGMSLLRLPFEPQRNNKGQLLVMQGSQTAVGVAADCALGRLYWTDIAGGTIRTSLYNGTNSEVLLSHGVESPEGIAVDWVSGNIFWTDSKKDTVEVFRVESREHKILINQGLVNPRGIACHPSLGKIYWSDWNRVNPKIEVANMDGSERTIFIDENLGLPNMLTIDFERNDLCWTDAGLHRLECIGLGGQRRRVIYTPAEYPFGITIVGGYIYWTDWETSHYVHKVDRNGGEANPLEVPLGGNGKLYGIVEAPSRCPRVTNPCSVSNGGCLHLCLPNGRGGRTCACPDGGVEGEDCNRV